MEVINAVVRIDPTDVAMAETHLRKIEQAYRICYRSEGKMSGEGHNLNFIRDKIAKGHESPLEHVSVSFIITCDRGVTHELVRHRLASYSQESTRYCNYSKGGLKVISPNFWAKFYNNSSDFEKIEEITEVWSNAMSYAEASYNKLIELGATPQEARSVLPNSTATMIMITANLREYRHIMKLRTSPAAHPQMREVAQQMLMQLKWYYPLIFEDISGGIE